MATTLTRVPTGEALTLRLVFDVAHEADVPTVVHRPIGRAAAEFTVHPAGPRTGTYRLLCADELEAIALESLLRQSGPFRIAGSVATVVNRTFMVTGRVALELDRETQRVCVVSADYTEKL